MTLNASKCYLLVAGYKEGLVFVSVEDVLLCEEQSAKLLGILIDSSNAKMLLQNYSNFENVKF